MMILNLKEPQRVKKELNSIQKYLDPKTLISSNEIKNLVFVIFLFMFF